MNLDLILTIIKKKHGVIKENHFIFQMPGSQ